MRRATVEGWRWDFLTLWGWAPSSGVLAHYGRSSEPLGWFDRESAVCLRRNHHAPDPDCACGLHGIEHLSLAVADRLDQLNAQRDAFIAKGEIPAGDTLVLTLSRVTLEDVLPTAWPDDAAALAAHPDAVPDPPHTIRGHRKIYREVFVDRPWPSLPGAWPASVRPKRGVHYRPDLGAWVRRQVRGGAL